MDSIWGEGFFDQMHGSWEGMAEACDTMMGSYEGDMGPGMMGGFEPDSGHGTTTPGGYFNPRRGGWGGMMGGFGGGMMGPGSYFQRGGGMMGRGMGGGFGFGPGMRLPTWY
jgi:hypothetical protein